MTPETKLSNAVRLVVTAILIAEYGLLKINAEQDLKMRVRAAIGSCRKVQDFFIHHPNTTAETKAIFKEQFMGDEIVVLTELLETCFGLSAASIDEIIVAVKGHLES